MLRISKGEPEPDKLVLRLEGRLVGPWVEELRSLCEPALGEGVPVVLELEQVSYADRNGVSLLRELARRRVRLANRPAYLAAQIEAP